MAKKIKSETPAKHPGGRPRLEFNTQLFEGLCRYFCTLDEVSGIMQMSPDTIERRCKDIYDKTFEEAYKQFSASGRMSLRRAQFKAAESGNPTMLIWLGKQVLNQSDRQEVAATNLNINWDDLTENELERIAAGESAAAVIADRSKHSAVTSR